MKGLMLCALISAIQLVGAIAEAQYSWSVRHTDFDGVRYYSFDAIACNDSLCIAAGSRVDTLLHRSERMFYRSTDHGFTWADADPHLPYDSIVREGRGEKYFTAVRLVDDLHAFAAGNGNVRVNLYSTDGGRTWSPSALDFDGYVYAVDFANYHDGLLFGQENIDDPADHLFVQGGGRARIFATSDAGAHWDSVDIRVGRGFTDVHLFSKREFSLFHSPDGAIWHSTNNGVTFDTTTPVFSASSDPNHYFALYHAQFRGRDTIVAYGQVNLTPNDPSNALGLLVTSTNGGKDWSPSITFSSVWSIQTMSDLSRDTVIAGGWCNGNILVSLDHGMTWRSDSLFMDTDYPAYNVEGMCMTASGTPLLLTTYQTFFRGTPSIILLGSVIDRGVAVGGTLDFNHRIFPDPAVGALNIVSIEASTPYRIIDLMGRVVKSGMVADHATIAVDVSTLPRGVYFVFVDSPEGNPIPVGKLLLVAP